MSTIRTLFVSSSGLENAKRLVTSYKKGEIPLMTPELWRAKKIVDSTLHPGMRLQLSYLVLILAMSRHRPTRLPALPHVLLRHLEPHRHSRHAHA